uniref:flagellar hook-basal body complex protein n=1 Tax=Pollutimonas bauzanensis TaxID=658167 RepID=UPI00333F1320
GSATGEYASMSIAADGSIVANYTNGETKSVGTLVLADFNNLQGLQPAGGNAWVETAASGQPILGTPGTNSLATIKGQAVEESNVDMSQELVNMIIAQRTYQANAQTIKTQDQVLQTLINMR